MSVFILLSIVLIAATVWAFCARLFNGSHTWLAVLLSVALPAASVAIYWQVGNPNAVNFVADQRAVANNQGQATSQQGATLSAENLDKAIVALEEQLKTAPNDTETLTMLANSYLLRERFADSARILERLIALNNTPELMVKAADAYAMADGGRISARASDLIRQTLLLQPNQPQALWLAGMEAAQQGDFANAKTFWQRLQPLLANTPQQQRELEQLIQQVDQELAASTAANTGNTTASDSGSNAVRTIVVEVRLDERLTDETEPSDTVFVFAKAASGPPAPLAVKRLTVADLPTQVTLTEGDAMMPQLSIANFPQIRLSAKISKSGNPTITDGDITSNTIDIGPDEPNDNPRLVIGQR